MIIHTYVCAYTVFLQKITHWVIIFICNRRVIVAIHNSELNNKSWAKRNAFSTYSLPLWLWKYDTTQQYICTPLNNRILKSDHVLQEIDKELHIYMVSLDVHMCIHWIYPIIIYLSIIIEYLNYNYCSFAHFVLNNTSPFRSSINIRVEHTLNHQSHFNCSAVQFIN